MRNETTRDIQRVAARAILGMVLGLLAFLIAATPVGGPLTAVVTAQTGSPSPSETASPTESPSEEPSPSPSDPPEPIQWVNPHEGTSNEISMKSDGVDGSYHLVAWVSEVPANPLVEFEYQDDNLLISIGAATRVAGTNTWELNWSNPPADGTYTLVATLYDGQTVAGRDEIEVIVNNADGPRDEPLLSPEPQGETVELVDPVNGGNVGFYTTGSGTAQTTNAVLTVSVSEGTESVSAYYTMTPEGTEPEWTSCGGNTNKPADAQQFKIRCRLGTDGVASAVTGIAVVANENDTDDVTGEIDDGIDAGDAHRVFGYTQVPTTVTLPAGAETQRQNLTTNGYPCSQPITATVLDQNGKPIFGANVDVHATGPTDNLFFDDSDTSGDNTSRTQPPDQGAHRLEPGMNCEAADNPALTTSNQQGSHDRPPGTPDIKHIESFPSTASAITGSNINGEFSFQLRLLDQVAGETQYTVWADSQNDDIFCSSEPSVNGAIGWSQDVFTVTGVEPDTTTCPTPTPTPTESPSETPTGDPTTTPPEGERCPEAPNDGRNHIVGTPGDDKLEGTEGDDVICGLGGDDTITGLGGDDLIYGGDGADTIDGGAGNDEIHGGDGKDSIVGGGGNDTIRGGLQNDVILGNAGSDLLIGNNGDDVIRGGKNADTIKGGPGKDSLRGGTGRDDIRGGGGKDTLQGGAGADTLRGGKGDDLLKGGAGNDTLRGGRGTDTCAGGGGSNRFFSCERRP